MKSKNKVIGILLIAIVSITIIFFTNENLAVNVANDEEKNSTENVDNAENTNDVADTANTSKNTESAKTENTGDNKEITGEQIVKETTNLKIVPVINATDIVEVKKDEKVNVIETINGWVCIQKDTTKGWIRKEKLTTTAEIDKQKEQNEAKKEEEENQKPIKTAYVKETSVNMRKSADQSSEIVDILTQNTGVDVYSEENGWSKVKFDGKEGYISTELLSDSKVEVKKEENTTTSRGSTKARTEKETSKKEETKKATTATGSTGAKGATVIETAKSYLGSSYVYGASGPSSFDCSGFTSYVFKLHGVNLARTAQAQFGNGTAVDRGNLQPGDLVLFGSSTSSISHVGIYMGGGQIIHAANKSRGVTTDTINSGYYNNKYVGARRVIN